METVLCTGAAGFVGCVLVPHLLQEGYKVVALDRYKHRNPGLLAHCGNPNLEIIRGDVRDPVVMTEAVKKADYIIPLAAVVGAPACDQDVLEATETNLNSILMLVRLRSKEQRILFPSTNSGYGTTLPGEVCTEDFPLNPISHYGKTKTEAEDFVLQRGNSLSYRFATAFGCSPRMRLDLLVNDFTYRAVRDKSVVLYEPHFRRNYIHVRDMARAFVHAIRNWDMMLGKPYNCGLPQFFTKECLCKFIQVFVPSFQYFVGESGKDPDKRDYNVSVQRLKETGFEASTPLSWGIDELIKAYQMLPVREFYNA